MADEDSIEVLQIDNSAVRVSQEARLAKLRSERDEGAAKEALNALTTAARENSGNLLDLSVKVRARCV